MQEVSLWRFVWIVGSIKYGAAIISGQISSSGDFRVSTAPAVKPLSSTQSDAPINKRLHYVAKMMNSQLLHVRLVAEKTRESDREMKKEFLQCKPLIPSTANRGLMIVDMIKMPRPFQFLLNWTSLFIQVVLHEWLAQPSPAYYMPTSS